MRKKQSCAFNEKEFYGSTTIGERGQVVIPADARRNHNLQQGDKLLVFGMGDVIICMKLAHLEKIASSMSSKLSEIRSLLQKSLKN